MENGHVERFEYTVLCSFASIICQFVESMESWRVRDAIQWSLVAFNNPGFSIVQPRRDAGRAGPGGIPAGSGPVPITSKFITYQEGV